MSSIADVRIIHEDEHILVIDKPFGLVVNRSITTPEGTLQDFLDSYIDKPQSEDPNEEFISRNGIVHRLDKDTSGVLLVAKNAETFEELKDQFKTREVQKQYFAVAMGHFKDKLAVVKASIARDPKNRLKMAIVKQGRFALTNFELLDKDTVEGLDVSYLKVKPMTGRTHQIRVHLAALNHHVAGDPIYLSKKKFEESINVFGRLMLHAYSLTFTHPKSREAVTFTAPLPPEFEKLYSKPL